MKTSPDIVRYASHQDYLNKKAGTAAAKKAASSIPPGGLDPKAGEEIPSKVPVDQAASSVQISEEAKELSKESSKDLSKDVSSQMKTQSKTELGKGLLKGLSSVPGIPVPIPSAGGVNASPKADGAKATGKDKAPELIQEPGIFFISGLTMFSSDGKGVEAMSQGIP